MVSIDETTDSAYSNVAKIIVGRLQPQNPSNMIVIYTEYLDKVYESKIFLLFDKAMDKFWGKYVRHNNVFLFISNVRVYLA